MPFRFAIGPTASIYLTVWVLASSLDKFRVHPPPIEGRPVLQGLHALTPSLPLDPLTVISDPVGHAFAAESVRLTVFPVSVVLTPIGVLADAEALAHAVVPFAVVDRSVFQRFHSLAMELTVFPVTCVTFTVSPDVLAPATRLIVLIFTLVHGLICILSFALSMALSANEFSLKLMK